MEPTPLPSPRTRAERARLEQLERDRRHRLAREVASDHDGLATRAMRIDPDAFLDQVAAAAASRRPRPGAA